jgi:phage protein U
MLALFGELLFDTLSSPEGIYVRREYTYAEHKVIEARPRLQWLAQELQRISLDLSLHVAFVNPLLQMRALRAAAEDHQARALIFGNGIHLGHFVIEALEETHQQLADDGSYIAISARVELREWVPGVDFDPLSPPRRTTPPPGIVQQTAPPTSAPASTITQLPQRSGVRYSSASYQQPGVSGVAGRGPGAVAPGNAADVAPSTIVRTG